MSAYQNLPPPVPGPFSTFPIAPGSVLTANHDGSATDTTGKFPGTGKVAAPVQHPNGSEGWLPVAEKAQPSSDLMTATPQPLTSGERSSELLSKGTGPEETSVRADGATQHVSDHLQRSAAAIFRRSTSSQFKSIPGRSNRPVSEARSLPNSAFAGGAGTTGPLASAEDDAQRRSRVIEAHRSLTPAQKSKIAREESFTAERISMIIKEEAKTEKEALSVAIDELESMQKVQRNAVKNESRIQASHAKVLGNFKKREAAYLNAKRRYELALAELNSESETLDTLRASSREATERMQDKAAEVDILRKTLAVDSREREVKLAQLNGPRSSFWCF